MHKTPDSSQPLDPGREPEVDRDAELDAGLAAELDLPAGVPSDPDGPAAERRQAVIAAEQHGLRVDKVLVALAPEFSRSHLQRLLERGLVALDGRPLQASSHKVRAGQSIELVLEPTDESRAFRPQALPLAIVHEDEHLLVIDKPAGLVVHPAPGHWQGTLLNALLAHHEAAATLPRAGIVHRLDKDTSGLMLVGKSLPAVTALVRQIAAREVHRRYLAIAAADAAGRLPAAPFTVDAPIGRDPRSRVRMAVVPVGAGGRAARTDFEPLAAHDGFVALRCTLHSGRTHQIRVHLASRGWPLVADALYGGRPALGLARQALHAVELALAHPVGGAPLRFCAGLPDDLTGAWRALGVG